MKKYHAWIIYNGFLTHSKFLTLFSHLQFAMRQKNITCQLVKHHELIFVMHDEKNEIVRKYIGQLPDFILFWDKDILLAQQLEACNIPLYNCAKAIEKEKGRACTHTVSAGASGRKRSGEQPNSCTVSLWQDPAGGCDSQTAGTGNAVADVCRKSLAADRSLWASNL